MIRAVSAIVAALEFVAPKFPHKAEASVHLQQLAIKHDLDPFTIIAVVRNESAWQSGAINRRTGARGLGQIMPTNYRKCVEAPDGSECERIKAALLGWKYNLSETARTMATWRAYCNRRVGSELAIHWLPGYQGLDMRRGAICGHRKQSENWVPLATVPKLTEKVMAKRRELVVRFGKPASSKPANVNVASSKPASVKSASSKPASDKPAGSKTASSKPASDKSVGSKAASNKQANSKQASNKQASNKQASNKQASNKSATNQLASAKPGSGKPSNAKPPIEKSAQGKPTKSRAGTAKRPAEGGRTLAAARAGTEGS